MINFKDLMNAAADAGATYEPLPNGEYEAVVEEASHTQTSTGKTMFKMTYKITSGPFANRKVWGNQTISPENPNALGYFFRAMAALGLDSDFFGAGPTPDQVTQHLVGRSCIVVLTQREWNGEMRNEVKSLKKGGGGGSLPMGQQTMVPNVPMPGASNPGGIPAPTADPGASAWAPPKLPF